MEVDPDSLNYRFGKLLARRRKSRGMTQIELASQLKISVSSISQMETGTSSPSFEMIKNLAAALDYDPSAFFTENFESKDEASKLIREIYLTISKLSPNKLLEIRDVIGAIIKRI